MNTRASISEPVAPVSESDAALISRARDWPGWSDGDALSSTEVGKLINALADRIEQLASTRAQAGPWEALLALVKAADEAAEWITNANRLAKEFGTTIDSLPHGRRKIDAIAPSQRGKPEVAKLRAAIRKARAALAQVRASEQGDKQ